MGKRSAGELQSAIRTLQKLINQITGYDSCERLKEHVNKRDSENGSLKSHANASKGTYHQAIEERAKCQRELNALLQRKHLRSKKMSIYLPNFSRTK